MKNKLLKIGKPMLSLVVALAVVAMSLFAAIPGINLGASAATVTDTWDGTKATAFQSGTGTEADPYIIATAEQLAYAALDATLVSADKYFKVVDDAVFDMNGMTDITLDSTVGDIRLATATGVGSWTSDAKTFAGNFDGNGVVIYNLYSAGGYCGLFPHITTDNTAKAVTIKNITVVNSRFNGYHYSGAIVGLANATTTSQSVTFENCKVSNCWMSDNGNTNNACNRTTGTIVGSVGHNKTTVKNCFALDNITSATDITGGFIGNTSAYAPSSVISSSISIGTLPYSQLSEGSTKTLETKSTDPGCYSNVYTDQTVDAKYAGITTLSADDMSGSVAKANMPNLDWSQWVAFDGEYPDFRSNHTLSTVSNGDAGHTTSCSDCGKSLNETHNFVEDTENLLNKCACGYTTPITQIKDTWDGTQATGFAGGTGTADNPYIIATAEQMAYAALSQTLDSTGKYFKVTDNAVFNMNGMMGITVNSTAEEVKSATKNDGYKWNSDSSTFAGNFDGNGVIIYNVYTNGAYAGLFPNINTNNDDKSAAFQNVTVKASCFIGYHYAGGIVGNATAGTTSQKLNFNNCAVINCYITDNNNKNNACNRTAGTIAGSVAHNGTTIENCLAKGNLLVATDIKGGLIGNTSGYSPDVVIKNSVSIGTLPYPTLMAGSTKTLHPHATAAGGYKNVYTDQVVDQSTYDSNQVIPLTTEQLSGSAVAQNTNLDFTNIWFANDGTVELQVSHSLEGSADPDDNYVGHIANCKECGLVGAIVTNHNYDSEYTCTVCGFTCDHQNEDYITVEEDLVGDCVTAPHTATICACGHVDRDEHGTADGHKLVKTDAVANTCADDGNVEYWTCEICGNIFLTDDEMAGLDTAVSEEDVVLAATGNHVPLKDSDGKIVYGMDGKNHWMNCETCKCELEKATHTIEYTIDGANSHSGKCAVCLYEISENEAHNFGDDNECDTCEWICLHDKTVVKVDAAEPDCENDGCYEHYECTVCKLVFSDATVATPIDKDTVIIEKLGHDYIDLNSNGKPVYDYDEKAHWYNCETCGKGSYAEHTIEVDEESYEGVYKWCEDADGYGCDYSTFDYAVVNEDNSVAVTATTNAFSKDVITDIFNITKEDTNYETIAKIFTDAGHSSFAAYEISPSEEVAEGCKATVTIRVPDIFGTNAVIYLVDVKTGELKKLDTIVETITDPEDEEEEIIIASAKTDSFGFVAIASSEVTANGEAGGNNNGNFNNSGSANGDSSPVSPATGENTAAIVFIIAILASVTVLFVRKAKI